MGGIYCLFIYSSITSRSQMNYNELNLSGPQVESDSDVIASQTAAGKAGNLLGTINTAGCKGAECCFEGTQWDNAKLKCVPVPATSASAAPTAPIVGGFTTMGQSGPFAHSPSEYDSYGKV